MWACRCRRCTFRTKLLSRVNRFSDLGDRVNSTQFMRSTSYLLISRKRTEVAPTFIFIRYRLIKGQPNRTSINACFCNGVIASLHHIQIKRSRRIFPHSIIFDIRISRTYRAGQFLRNATTKQVFVPNLTRVTNNNRNTTTSPIIARIRRRSAQFSLNCLHLNHIHAYRIVRVPNNSPVFTMRSANIQCANKISRLSQRGRHPIFRHSAPTQSLRRRMPKEVFRLQNSISQLTPNLTIIFTFSRRRLNNTINQRAQRKVPPNTSIPRTVYPNDGSPSHVYLFVR